MNLPGYKPTIVGHTGQIKRAIKKIKKSKRPLIYAGGGVRLSHAEKELLEFAEKNDIPVITTLMGISAFPEDHRLFCGIAGSHGFEHANRILNASDLCICVGARMSDRGVNDLQHHLNQVDLIHIDIDPAEISKNINQTEIPIVGDAKTILMSLNSQKLNTDTSEWLEEIEEIKEKYPLIYSECLENGKVNPKRFFTELGEITADDATMIADVGLNQIWSALYYPLTKNRRFFTSGGLGTMGYSIPATAGAVFAAGNPEDKKFYCVCGDGSFQMSMAELSIVAQYNLNMTILLFVNNKLGMVRQLQHDTYGKEHYSGTDLNFEIDFMKLAESYGIEHYNANTTEEALEAVKKSKEHFGPTLIQVNVDEDFLRI